MTEFDDHWAYKIARDLIKHHPTGQIVCASGISPSGPVHVGNLREVMTTDMVHRALRQLNANTSFLFSWDDFDRLRKVPFGMPEELICSIGKPYSDITDPSGEFDSYATKFINDFEISLRELGVTPRFIRQSNQYKSGAYDEKIRFALINRKEIAAILARNMTQGMTAEQIDNYYPISVYSRYTGKDNTKVLSFDGDSKIEYLCIDTGNKDVVDFTQDHIVKLPWKIDWPMRWQYENVIFEPGGPDHASPGSSYDVSSQIAREIFHFRPPDFQEYGFIRIKGQNRKMSSSSGNVITPDELLKLYSPEIVRWLYAKTFPSNQLDIGLDIDVIRTYAEYDQELSENDQELASLTCVNINQRETNNIPFRKIFGLGEATGYDIKKVNYILQSEKETFVQLSIEDRLNKSNYWSENYYPEGRCKLLSERNLEYFEALSDIEKQHINKLAALVLSDEKYDISQLEVLLYAIPRTDGMSEEEKKKAQKQFFKNTYNLLFGQSHGPKLPTYFWSVGTENLKDLLVF